MGDANRCLGLAVISVVVTYIDCYGLAKGIFMQTIQLRDAKAKLSSLVEAAANGETIVITRHGKPRAVVLGVEEWDRLRTVPSFGRLLSSAPLDDGDLPARDTSPPETDRG